MIGLSRRPGVPRRLTAECNLHRRTEPMIRCSPFPPHLSTHPVLFPTASLPSRLHLKITLGCFRLCSDASRCSRPRPNIIFSQSLPGRRRRRIVARHQRVGKIVAVHRVCIGMFVPR